MVVMMSAILRRRRQQQQGSLPQIPPPDSVSSPPTEAEDNDTKKKRNLVVGSKATLTTGREERASMPIITEHNYHYTSEQQQQQLKYTVAKWAILRLLAFIYWIAFLGALYQNEGLMGSDGLQPAGEYMEQLLQQATTAATPDNQWSKFLALWQGFCQHPTLFWIIPFSDDTVQWVYYAGLGLSTVALIGMDSWLIQFLLWLLYFSIVTISGRTSFYSYGWESQLLETGFLAIFLCPLPHYDTNVERRGLCLSLYDKKKRKTQDDSNIQQQQQQPSNIILWLFSWLCFRISMGAGLIKLRGSSCWTKRTCLFYHFETQPIPSPLSFIFHFLPRTIQSQMVDADLIVQVYTSWFVLIPAAAFSAGSTNVVARVTRWLARVGGFVQAGFMVAILLSGNFAFLNHLTIIPALACLDNACWPQWIHRLVGATEMLVNQDDDLASYKHHNRYQQIQPKANSTCSADASPSLRPGRTSSSMRSLLLSRRAVVDIPLLIWILYLSWPVVENLLQIGGTRQTMNRSFGAFRLVNTYGAFGSVGESRFEPIVQISDDLNSTSWYELEFPCKPGNLYRRPCFCAPYHYRVDWNIWFIGFEPHQAYLRQRESWLYSLLVKIMEPEYKGGGEALLPDATLQSHRPWLALLDSSTARYLEMQYYQKGRSPLFAKVDMYHYQMAAPLWTIVGQLWSSNRSGSDNVVWWTRSFKENLIPPVRIHSSGKQLQLASY